MRILLLLIISSCFFAACSNNQAEMKGEHESVKTIVLSDSATEKPTLNDSVNITSISEDSLVEEELLDTTGSVFQYFEDYAALTTKADLYAAFDTEYLEDSEEWYAEGTEKFEVTYLTTPLDSHIIKYCWSKSDNEKLTFIEAEYFLALNPNVMQVIKSKSGLYLGMPLNEMVEWNTTDFNFWGFSWDFEGGIEQSAKGRLAELSTYVKLSLDYNFPVNDYNHLMGDISLSSADSAVKAAPIIIDRFTYNL